LEELQKGIGGIISELLKPGYHETDEINPELLKEAYRKKKRKKPRW